MADLHFTSNIYLEEKRADKSREEFGKMLQDEKSEVFCNDLLQVLKDLIKDDEWRDKLQDVLSLKKEGKARLFMLASLLEGAKYLARERLKSKLSR